MNTINVENCKTLLIGRRGENEVTTVAFDFTEWQTEFGSGVVDLYVKRFGDDSAYPVVLTIDGTIATWTVTATDTNVAGYGKAEYVYRVDGKIAKSAVFPFFVAEDIGQPASEPPDPYESWLEQLTALGAETEAHAQAAEQSAENAAESAQEAAQSAASAEGYAGQAATAAGLAQAAQTASEAARDAAQTAQASAEASATAASGSAASAASSATAAAGSASDASASATAAGASATTASTAATQAEAAKTAAQAAQSAAEDAAEDAQQAAQQAHVEYEQLSGEVDDLSDEVAQQKSALNAIEDVLPAASGWIAEDFTPESGYYNRSGAQKTSQYTEFAVFNYSGARYKFSCNQTPNSATIAPVLYLDSNGGVVGTEPADNTKVFTDYELTVPTGTATIIINYAVGNTLYVYTSVEEFVAVAPQSEVDDIRTELQYLNYINVKKYGAKGDGETNDIVAIQAALDAAESQGGGTVFFPLGVYNVARIGQAFIKAYLYIPSNTKLLFEKGATIKRADTVSAHLLMTKNAADATLYNGANNIIIDGATIDSGGGNIVSTSICLSHSDNVLIKDCVFKNGGGQGHYIEVNSSRFVRIVGCDFHPADYMNMYVQIEAASGHGNAGVNDNTPAYDVSICRCRFAKGTTASVAVCNEDADDPSHDIRIYGCAFSGGASANGYVKFTPGIKNVDVYENTFYPGETTSRGVKIGDTTGSCTVHDNRFNGFVQAIEGTVAKYNNMIDGVLTN